MFKGNAVSLHIRKLHFIVLLWRHPCPCTRFFNRKHQRWVEHCKQFFFFSVEAPHRKCRGTARGPAPHLKHRKPTVNKKLNLPCNSHAKFSVKETERYAAMTFGKHHIKIVAHSTLLGRVILQSLLPVRTTNLMMWLIRILNFPRNPFGARIKGFFQISNDIAL